MRLVGPAFRPRAPFRLSIFPPVHNCSSSSSPSPSSPRHRRSARSMGVQSSRIAVSQINEAKWVRFALVRWWRVDDSEGLSSLQSSALRRRPRRNYAVTTGCRFTHRRLRLIRHGFADWRIAQQDDAIVVAQRWFLIAHDDRLWFAAFRRRRPAPSPAAIPQACATARHAPHPIPGRQ